MSDDDCQIQSDLTPSRRVSSKVLAQRFPRQGDYFRVRRRGGTKGESVRRNQGRPTHSLTGRSFLYENVLFLAPDLHWQSKPDSAAFDQEQAISRVPQTEQQSSARNNQPGTKLQDLLNLGGRETF